MNWNNDWMIRRICEQLGPEIADEYQRAFDGLATSLDVIRDYFADNGLPRYADFFDSMLIPHLRRHDYSALLAALDTFELRYNSFQQYRVLIRDEVERLYRIQQRLLA